MNPHPAERPRKPTRIALANVVALVIGVALALPVLRSGSARLSDVLGPWDSLRLWYQERLPYAITVLDMAALMLLPIAFIHRSSRDEPLSPAEFLLGCVGLPRLASLAGLGWLTVAEQAAGPVSFAWLSVGALAATGLLAGRRLLPCWARSVLLMAAWLSLYMAASRIAWLKLVGKTLRPLAHGHTILQYSLLHELLGYGPWRLLRAIPTAAALFGSQRGSRPIGSILGWVGLGLASIRFVLEEADYLLFSFSEDPRNLGTDILARAAALLTVAVLGVLSVRLFGPAWNRWIEPRHDEGNTPPSCGISTEETR